MLFDLSPPRIYHEYWISFCTKFIEEWKCSVIFLHVLNWMSMRHPICQWQHFLRDKMSIDITVNGSSFTFLSASKRTKEQLVMRRIGYWRNTKRLHSTHTHTHSFLLFAELVLVFKQRTFLEIYVFNYMKITVCIRTRNRNFGSLHPTSNTQPPVEMKIFPSDR